MSRRGYRSKPHRINGCRPRAVTDAPAVIPDSKIVQFTKLLDDSGACELIDDKPPDQPGPPGLPVRTVLVGLLLSLHYHRSALLADAWRVLLDELPERARQRFGIPRIETNDLHGRIAFSRRVYRSMDRLTTALDPCRRDRRRRLSPAEAQAVRAAWEADITESEGRRRKLQELCDRLVLIVVRNAQREGNLKEWQGDVAVDTTPTAEWSRPPSLSDSRGTMAPTAGQHYCAGDEYGTYGYSATVTVAARQRPAETPRKPGKGHPQLILGLVVDTPGKRIGLNAVHTLRALGQLGLPIGLLVADRAYTDQVSANFAQPARTLGYQLLHDYKRDRRGIQGTHNGALLVDGTLACPQMPPALAGVTTGISDRIIRNPEAQPHLIELIAAREPLYLKLKQSPDSQGTLRLQCPAAGTSPSVICPRFNRVHGRAPQPTSVDLSNRRRTAAHPAAKPTVPISEEERLRPPPESELPKICQHPTMTVRPGDLGRDEKLRQDRHYLSSSWRNAYGPMRANSEGVHGRAKGTYIDIGDPKKRLAHGLAAQSILLALMTCVINLHILSTWKATHTSQTTRSYSSEPSPPDARTPATTTTENDLSPPGDPAPR